MQTASTAAPMLARSHWLRWLVILLALVLGGWFAFDGTHALVTGDYVTPESGRFAGELGPWSKLVSAVGLEPRSALVIWIHVGLGTSWLLAAAAFALGLARAREALTICATASLWYLPFGTLISVVLLVLLNFPTLVSRSSNPGSRP